MPAQTVVLSDLTSGAVFDAETDGGVAEAICTVTIVNDDARATRFAKALQASGLRYTMLCPGFMVDELSAHKEAAARVFVGTNPTLLDGLGGLVATYDEVAAVATRAVLEAPTAWQNALVGVASREGDYWPRFARGVWRYTIQRQ